MSLPRKIREFWARKKFFCEDEIFEIFEIFEKKIFSLEGEKKIHFSWNWHRLRKKKLETCPQNYRIFFSILRPEKSKIGQKNSKIAISRPQGIFRPRKYILRKRIFFKFFENFFHFLPPKKFFRIFGDQRLGILKSPYFSEFWSKFQHPIWFST